LDQLETCDGDFASLQKCSATLQRFRGLILAVEFSDRSWRVSTAERP